MHDARTLLDLGDEAVRRLERRGYSLDLATIEDLFTRRNSSIKSVDEMRVESKRVAAEVGKTAKAGGDASELKERARELKDQIRVTETAQEKVEAELRDILLTIPNFPAEDVPEGASEEFNVEIRKHGNPPAFAFDPKDHVDLGEAMNIFDFGRAAKLSGSRFSVTRRAGAVLERALANFFLTLHTSRHGYEEIGVPNLVNRQTMTGTGQLPKFEQDLFKTGVADRELFLIPTAEVPLTNLHAEEILPAEDLPYAYTAWTPCFRSEAGSYGRDTRGILRLHQFAKVEMVRICRPEDSRDELETMVGHAETCLKELDLAYRVVKLAAGDLGFSATVTYDIEVWLPSQGMYREISSCSDTSTFQARRAAIRTKSKDGKRGLAATLNGSGLPIGRTMVIPDALVPFTGFRRIAADGTPES
jgi:seryl-tRNA synthetase